MKQRMWPRHCVQDSWGAELHKDLKVKMEILTKHTEFYYYFQTSIFQGDRKCCQNLQRNQSGC